MTEAELLAQNKRLEAEIRAAQLLVGDLLGIPPDLAKHLDLVAHLEELVSCEGKTRYQQGRIDAFDEVISLLQQQALSATKALAAAERTHTTMPVRMRRHSLRLQLLDFQSQIAEIRALQAKLPTPEAR